MCNICKIKNMHLLEDIEHHLEANKGCLTKENKKELQVKYSDVDLNDINDQDCKIHWNFHQVISREAKACDDETPVATLATDIGKDEATILYELLNKQTATFNCLSRKLNSAIEEHDGDLTSMLVHPNTCQFYSDLALSIRATVKEIRELNIAVNGAKDGASEGLKALAEALKPQNKNEEEKDLTTKIYDNVEAI